MEEERKKRVLILNDKPRNIHLLESRHAIVAAWKELLEESADVEIVDGLSALRARLFEGRFHTVIFISAEMIPVARNLRMSYPSVRMLVFTGRMPDNEITIVEKPVHASVLTGLALG